eukprot:CAMPEP_0117545800 /NCGR_PEP_ID=MMETSP0784-20121206/46283_1 /TAXON_ID=39447 /ORGANISM="" /LENGTH=255 /DNA_ID=CAMNT_0005342661 /DNA_START=49 /DNA_END=816 /DNA_ORIENTATION=+
MSAVQGQRRDDRWRQRLASRNVVRPVPPPRTQRLEPSTPLPLLPRQDDDPLALDEQVPGGAMAHESAVLRSAAPPCRGAAHAAASALAAATAGLHGEKARSTAEAPRRQRGPAVARGGAAEAPALSEDAPAPPDRCDRAAAPRAAASTSRRRGASADTGSAKLCARTPSAELEEAGITTPRRMPGAACWHGALRQRESRSCAPRRGAVAGVAYTHKRQASCDSNATTADSCGDDTASALSPQGQGFGTLSWLIWS